MTVAISQDTVKIKEITHMKCLKSCLGAVRECHLVFALENLRGRRWWCQSSSPKLPARKGQSPRAARNPHLPLQVALLLRADTVAEKLGAMPGVPPSPDPSLSWYLSASQQWA